MTDYQLLKTEKDWQNYFLSELQIRGYRYTIEDWLTADNALRFVHFTPNLKEIVKKGYIQVSGGGLMGVVYVTPLRNTQEVHNLGKYIINTELPQTQKQCTTDCLIFEISYEKHLRSLEIGSFNYIFESYRYAEHVDLSKQELATTTIALENIKRLMNDFETPLNISTSKRLDDFFNQFTFLKHIYFETLNEYLYTRQNNPESYNLAQTGEVMAKFVKDYFFTTVPVLKKSFSTTHFITDTFFHLNNLSSSTIVDKFSPDDFLFFLQGRIKYYFEHLISQPVSLTGRYLLKSRNSKDRYELETTAINKMWKEREKAILFQYNTIPKGEIGLVPEDNIKVFCAKYDDGFVKDIEPVDVQINSDLINNSGSVLRIK